jgi:magnesium-protoporphyrin O-methyltransferase
MTDVRLGSFDHVVAMDSLIHYKAGDIAGALAGLAGRTRGSILFTFAPRTPLLSAMHAAGKLFPRGDRSPAIEPVSERTLRARLCAMVGPLGLQADRTERVASGFYTSQAMELVRE